MPSKVRVLALAALFLAVIGLLVGLRTRAGWGASEAERAEAECSLGRWSSCLRAGFAYLEGEGVTKDLARARELFRRACAHEEWLGCTNEALLLREGLAGAEDPPAATALLERACEHREPHACVLLGLSELGAQGREPDLSAAVEHLGVACERDLASGCQALGEVYRNGGQGFPARPGEAVIAFRRACALDPRTGCREAGQSYACGRGVPRDPVQAATLLERACRAKDERACDQLAVPLADEELAPRLPTSVAELSGVRMRAAINAAAGEEPEHRDRLLSALEAEAEGTRPAQFIRACLEADAGALEVAVARVAKLRSQGVVGPALEVLEGALERRRNGETSSLAAMVGAWGALGRPRLDGSALLPHSAQPDYRTCSAWTSTDYSAMDGTEAGFVVAVGRFHGRLDLVGVPDSLIEQAEAFSYSRDRRVKLAAYSVLVAPALDRRQRQPIEARTRSLATELGRSDPGNLYFRAFEILGPAAKDVPLDEVQVAALEAAASLPYRPPRPDVVRLLEEAHRERGLPLQSKFGAVTGIASADPILTLPDRAKASAGNAELSRRLGRALGGIGAQVSEGRWILDLGVAARLMRVGGELAQSPELSQQAERMSARLRSRWAPEGLLPGFGFWPMPRLWQEWADAGLADEMAHVRRLRSLAGLPDSEDAP